MAFVVTKSDGSTLAIVSTNSIDNKVASSIVLHGRGKLRWGNAVNENFVHMLENFADVTAPVNPIEGQLWAQKTFTGSPTPGSPLTGSPTPVTQINFWNGSTWVELLTTGLGGTNFVDVTGDTMTGDLILNSANLFVTGSGSPTTALDVVGDVSIIGNTSTTGDATFSGTVSINSSGSSPQPTALTINGDIDVSGNSVLSFGALFLNQGGGSAATAADIQSDGDLVIAAENTMHLNINSDGGSAGLAIRTGGNTNAATSIVIISSSGDITMDGDLTATSSGPHTLGDNEISSGSIEINRQGTGDRNSFIDFHSAGAPASVDRHARIIRGSGTNGTFEIDQTLGSGDLNLSRGGAPVITIDSASDIDANNNSIINSPSVAFAWVHFDQIGTIGIQESYNVSSVSDIDVGEFTVNLSSSTGSTSPCAIGTVACRGGSCNVHTSSVTIRTGEIGLEAASGTAIRGFTTEAGSGVGSDWNDINVVVFI